MTAGAEEAGLFACIRLWWRRSLVIIPYTFSLIRPLLVLLDKQLITPAKTPLSDVRGKDRHNNLHVQSTHQTHFTIVPNKKSKRFMHKFQQLNNLFH